MHERGAVSQALQVPKLLERIFSFLKEYRIRFVVSLVCRQWRDVARLFINESAHWYAGVGNGSRQQGDDLSSFHRANTLIYRQQFKGGTVEEVADFKNAICRRDPKETMADQRAALLISALPELRNIRTLVLGMIGGNGGGDPIRATVLKWSKDIITAAGPNLTSLTVDVLCHYVVPMAIISKSCPRLQSLVVKCETVFGPLYPVCLGRIQEESANQDSIASQPWSIMQSCELCYILIDAKPLEDIFRVCPRLKHLRIIGTQPRRTVDGLQIDLAGPDTIDLAEPDSLIFYTGLCSTSVFDATQRILSKSGDLSFLAQQTELSTSRILGEHV